ncbi:PREDICTED: signal transducer and activator of transcription 5A-like, partial [Rhagoletis zephyria]|uniref:signal transducer and activator of transcription 5A-like n=1 Tax=Rhagoletis zephyria TaxID=28612 RepID=UPI0008116ED4
MANWAQILALPESFQRRILTIYDQNQFFPIEVRKSRAEWIEKQDWSFYSNPNYSYDTNYLERCISLMQEFIQQVNQLLSTTNDISDKYKINNFKSNLQYAIESNNYEIIKHVYECLRNENVIIQRYREGLNERNPSHFHQLETKCQVNREKILYTEGLLKNINTLKENLIISKSQLPVLQNAIALQNPNTTDMTSKQNKIIELTNHINFMFNAYKTYKDELLHKHRDIITELESILSILITDLNVWKNNRKSMISNDAYDDFRQITEICQNFASNICHMWPQIKKMETLLIENQAENFIPEDHCREMKTKIIMILKSLVNQTFIVDHQPCQVIKTNTKLKKIVVNLLVGNIFKNHMNPSVVKVTIINENQAKQLYNDPDTFRMDTCSGEILNNTTVMEYNPSSKILCANFVNLQLKKIKRTEKKASESVMDEKSALLFSTEFFIEEDLRFNVKTISDPVVVIVHVNQEAHAQATITWDTAFAEPTRCPFEVPQEVRFGLLATVLSQKFFENTGRALSEDNIHFLAEKIFGSYIPDPMNTLVSWSRFSKEHLPGQTFTFWDWFYAILKLTSDHLRDIWHDNRIIGFLTRPRAEELLSEKPTGTFLLRFSDTKLGGISIASVDMNSEQKVMMVDPFCSKDLQLRKLADRLRDFDQFTHLYPNLPKDEAFGRYYSQVNNQGQTNNGYVRPMLVNYIPRFPNAPGGNADFALQGQFSNSFPMDFGLPSFGSTFENQFDANVYSVSSS